MADRGGLENRCGACVTVGSNPTPSARLGLDRVSYALFDGPTQQGARRDVVRMLYAALACEAQCFWASSPPR